MTTLLAVLIGGLPLWTQLGGWHLEHTHPAQGEFIEVDGYRLHYRLQGEGRPILLVHGANANLEDFGASLMPLLAREHRVLAFDRPGYGHSTRPRDDEWLDPGRQARLLLDAAAELGIERPLLVGHSWAGSVVMSALLHMPERISGGVLLAGAVGHWAGSLGWTYELASVPVLRELFAYSLVLPAGQFMLDSALENVHAPNPVPPDYSENIDAELALRPATFLHNARDMNRLSVYLQSLSRDYDRIDAPLLLIHGEDDELVPFWNHGQRLLPLLPQAEVELLPGVGHAPHHAEPQRVADRISAFLDALPPEAAE